MDKEIESGCVSGDCFNGTGKRVFENGYYEGEFRDGLFHGKGFLKYETGFYDGDFKKGKRNGIGEEFFLDKNNKSLISKATFKNDKLENIIKDSSFDVTPDKHYEIILKLNDQLILDEYLEDTLDFDYICDSRDARAVINITAWQSLEHTLWVNKKSRDLKINSIKDKNEYNYIVQFFNALFFIIKEISQTLNVSAKDFFGFFKSGKTEHLITEDQIELSHWVREQWEDFFNTSWSVSAFSENMNIMIDASTKNNADYYKKIYHEKYDGNFSFENLSIKETKATSKNQNNLNKEFYKHNNEFTVKFSVINKNYPEEFRKIGSKSEKVLLYINE